MSLSPYFENRKHIAVAIDISGGITPTLIESYIAMINQALIGKTNILLNVWFFDTEVHNEVQYNVIRGDALFECNWKYMKQNKINPDLFVLFSDGKAPTNTMEQYSGYCRTLFVIRKGNWKTSPFGELLEI